MPSEHLHGSIVLDGEQEFISDAHRTLLRKYRELIRKYQALVDKLENSKLDYAGTFELAWWAMRTISTALAIVQGSTLLLANPKFTELARNVGGKGEWRLMNAEEGVEERRYSTLRQLAMGEAAAARSDGSPCVVTGVFERIGGDQAIEVIVEREPRKSAGLGTAVVVVNDVTARIRAERELFESRQALAHQQRMRALGEVASGVAHDLNNMFGSLTLRLALVKADPAATPAQRNNVDAMSRILRDAAARVGRLQEFAHKPTARLLGSVDIGAIIRESVDMVRAEVEEKSSFAGRPVRIEVSLPSLPNVSAPSSAELRHMFINLILNARDAMPKGGKIRVEGKLLGPLLEITICDEGTGIPAELLPRIFEPFFTTKGKNGTGLGLSNACGLMESIGGSIRAENRQDGGASFRLIFQTATERNLSFREPSPKAMPGQRILVIDDDPEHLQMAKAVIELEDQQVEVAGNGKEALDRMRNGAQYDLVLCDAGMPGLNGWQVAGEIRVIAPETRVYLLTGWAQQIPEDDPRRRLVNGVLPKPMNLDRLRGLLAGAPESKPSG